MKKKIKSFCVLPICKFIRINISSLIDSIIRKKKLMNLLLKGAFYKMYVTIIQDMLYHYNPFAIVEFNEELSDEEIEEVKKQIDQLDD